MTFPGIFFSLLAWTFGATPAVEAGSLGRSGEGPHLIPLSRESVPIYRRGTVASFKTTYSGTVSIGSAAQEFSMVFDTGSAHVVLPSEACVSEPCLKHRRFDTRSSESARIINSDGSRVQTGWTREKVRISFGTGQVVGELVWDRLCLGPAQPSSKAGGALRGSSGPGASSPTFGPLAFENSSAVTEAETPPCAELSMVLATEMSAQPFKSFAFDGIVGLSLDALALSPDFSAFGTFLGAGKLSQPRFGFFLTDGDESELAVGGYNPERLLEPVSWTPVTKAEMGYWQVQILSIRVNGKEMDVCRDGTCRGIVDTGTSHLGVPSPHDKELSQLLSVAAVEFQDCRTSEAPLLEIELPGRTISLEPHNYMRHLPLQQGISLGSEVTNTEGLVEHGIDGSYCAPRLMPVRLPEPVGPKLFILGEPVLHRYYTVFDWEAKQVGMGLANNRWNAPQASDITG